MRLKQTLFLIVFTLSLTVKAQEDIGFDKMDFKKKQEFNSAFFDGCREFIIGNYEKSVGLFNTCIRLNPKSAVSYYKLSQSYQFIQQKGPSLYYAKQASKEDPKNPWYGSNYAEALLESKMYADAGKEFLRVAHIDPQNRLDFLIEATEAYTSGGFYKKAIEVLNLFEKESGLTESVSLEKERLWLMLGKKKKAEKELLTLYTSDTSSIMFIGYLADFYVVHGPKEKGKQKVAQILSKEPQNMKALYMKALLLKEEDKKEESFAFLKQGFSNKENDSAIKIAMLLEFMDAGNSMGLTKDQVFDLADAAMGAHPYYAPLLELRAKMYLEEGMPEKAKSMFRRSLARNPENWNGWNEVLLLDVDLKDLEGLASDSKGAIDAFPQEGRFYLSYMESLIRLKRDSLAISVALQALPLFPLDKSTQVNLLSAIGSSAYNLHRYKQSDSAFDEALKLDPSNQTILNNYAYFLALRGERLEKAAKMAKKCIELAPNNSNFLDTYGWVLFVQKNYDEAYLQLKKAVSINEKSPVILEHFGDALFEVGRKQEALKYWRKAIDAGGNVDELNIKINQQKL